MADEHPISSYSRLNIKRNRVATAMISVQKLDLIDLFVSTEPNEIEAFSYSLARSVKELNLFTVRSIVYRHKSPE